MSLEHKIDFKVIFSVNGANPNGDPLNGGRPRQTNDGYGEVSDVAIKRKIRNRLQDMGYKIFVQSEDRADDGYKSLKERAEKDEGLVSAAHNSDKKAYVNRACEKWIDVRSFGQVFAFKTESSKSGKKVKNPESLSVGVRGPVSIQTARSITPIVINEMQITKSVNSSPSDSGSDDDMSRDRMGMKYSIDYAVYSFNGSINVQLAEKTGFSEEDAEAIHKALETLFENDEASARPAGSMDVLRVYWWEHDSKIGKHSPSKMFKSVQIEPKTDTLTSEEDFEIKETPFPDVKEDIFKG